MVSTVDTSKRFITLSIYGAFFLIGLTFTVFGATMPFLIENYRINLAQAGLFASFMAMGRMLLVVLCGLLTDRIGAKWVVILGTLCLTLGLIGVGSLSQFSIALAFAFIAGIGHGAVDAAGSSTIMDMYPGRSSGMLNKANMFFAVGCLIGPLVSGIILSYTEYWRVVYYINAAIGVIITLFLVFQTFPHSDGDVKQAGSWPYRMLFTSSYLWLLSMVMFLYSGAGHSINTWINKYMGDVVRLPVFFASGTLAVYNLGLASGRFACSIGAEKLGYHRVIFLSALGGLVSMVVALFSPFVVLAITGLGFTGFFFGGLFPTAIAIAGGMYPEQKGFITGMLVMTAALGSMTIPAMTGLVSQAIGLERGMRSLVIWGIALFAVGVYIYRHKQKQKRYAQSVQSVDSD